MRVPCTPPSLFSLCSAGGTQGDASSIHRLSFSFCNAVGTQGEGVLVFYVHISPSLSFAMQQESKRMLVPCVHLFLLPIKHSEDSRGKGMLVQSAPLPPLPTSGMMASSPSSSFSLPCNMNSNGERC